MNDNMINRDYLRAELAYRQSRIRSDIAGRRRRRSLTRSADIGDATFGTVR